MIVFPFKVVEKNLNKGITSENENYNSTHFMNDHFSRELYTSIFIGNPKQEIKVILTYSDCGFMVGQAKQCIPGLMSNYNRNLSSDFEYTDLFPHNIREFEGGCSAEETLYSYSDLHLKNLKKFVDIGFYLGTDTNEEICGVVGFKMNNFGYHCEVSNNLIRSFKNKDYISNDQWYIKYTSENEGLLIIGAKPNEYINNYKDENLFTINSLIIGGHYPWSFNLDRVIVGDDLISSEPVRAEIDNDMDLIQGSEDYYKYIKENFFNGYFEKGICKTDLWELNTYNKYYVISCDKNKFTENDVKKFPDLIFKNFDFYKRFLLTYKDLFTETKYKYFFNMVFFSYVTPKFILGKIFLKKYPFIYSLEAKTISFYNDLSANDDNKDKNNEKNNNSFSGKWIAIYVVIFCISIAIIGVLCYFIGKNLNKLRKKRANELNDEYDYKPDTSKNNNNEINPDE